MTIIEKIEYLKAYYKERGMTFEKSLGVSKAAFSSMRRQNSKPGFNTLQAIILKVRDIETGNRINPYWVFGESEEVWVQEMDKEEVVRMMRSVMSANREIEKELAEIRKGVKELETKKVK